MQSSAGAREDCGSAADSYAHASGEERRKFDSRTEYITVTPSPQMRAAVLAAAGLPDLAANQQSAPRFALDEEKAREWLAAVTEQNAEDYDGTPDGDMPSVGPEWSPIWDDDYGSVTADLVSAALHSVGAITAPEGMDITYDYTSTEGETGYTWILYLPGHIKLSTYYSKITHLSGAEERGAAAALEILGEAVTSANRLLDDHDRYVSSLPLAVRAPEVARYFLPDGTLSPAAVHEYIRQHGMPTQISDKTNCTAECDH